MFVLFCVSLCYVCEGQRSNAVTYFPIRVLLSYVVPKLFLSLCCAAEMGTDFKIFVFFLIDVDKEKACGMLE